jgi:hypothetical protein
MLTAPVIALVGTMLGAPVNRKWLLLSGGIVLPFLAQHALQGWCPPVSLFRWLGGHTRREIDGERFVLIVSCRAPIGPRLMGPESVSTRS